MSVSGTTAVAILRQGMRVTCANVGDSRCVLGTETHKGRLVARELSMDHTPDLPDERSRITAAGGEVEPIRDENDHCVGPDRVWVKGEMTPGLGMSRSLGDTTSKSIGVVPTPECVSFTLSSQDRAIVIVSDGVTQFLTSQNIIDLVAKFSNPSEAADALLAASVRKWELNEYVVDDITAVVIFLRHMPPPIQPDPAILPASPDAPASAPEPSPAPTPSVPTPPPPVVGAAAAAPAAAAAAASAEGGTDES